MARLSLRKCSLKVGDMVKATLDMGPRSKDYADPIIGRLVRERRGGKTPKLGVSVIKKDGKEAFYPWEAFKHAVLWEPPL